MSATVIRRGVRISLLAAVLAVSTACSRIEIAYRQLDWVLPWYLESYMALSDEQDAYLKKHVDGLLAWHCHSQLPDYVTLIRQAGSQFQSTRVSRTDIENFDRRIERLWTEILHQASPALAGILSNAGAEQLDELLAGLEQRNREWLADFGSRTDREIRTDYRERMSAELKRWIGPLTDDQEQAVLDWSGSFRPLGLAGLAARQRWQSRLRSLLALRDDPAQFNPAIEELLVHPETLRTQDYQQLLAYNRQTTIDLVYRIAGSLNARQRRHLGKTAGSLAHDIEQLVCEDAEQQARDTPTPLPG